MNRQHIKKILLHFLLILPMQKRILFESNPELACNTMPVFEAMLKLGLNEMYKFVWLVEDDSKYKDYNIKNVGFINYNGNFIQKMKLYYLLYTSKGLIFSNRFLFKSRKRQITINLMHGMPLKKAGGYKEHDTCDYVISSGSRLNEIIARELDVPYNKIITLGYPRTDILNKITGALKKLGIHNDEKVIVWMPTFRKHKENENIEGKEYPNGIPLLNTGENLERINKLLNSCHVMLLIKIHPAQDMGFIKDLSSTNLKLVSDEQLCKCGTDTYELLAESSAMITDYSSVYYDYLLTEKPIGLVIDDIDQYIANRGLAVSDYYHYVKGTYISSLEEFEKFIVSIGSGENENIDELKWAKGQFSDFHDFNSTDRVVDFILKKLEEKK